MRQSLLILIVIFTSSFSSYSQNHPLDYPINYASIKDGWYEATVEYYTLSTSTRSTYTLNVQVKHDKVVKISFGNNESVHDGYNTHGYYYSGGLLKIQTDREGNAILATTKVTISKGGSYYYYKVTIE